MLPSPLPPPQVRKNAALLLFAAFPVVDPSAAPRDAEAGAQQQFDALHALLKDDCPSVREVAVQVRDSTMGGEMGGSNGVCS